jgi:hypothetical protein
MRGLVVRVIAAVLGGVCLAGSAAAQPDSKRETIDEILTRAVIERGALLACARLDQSRQTADLLVRSWHLDLSESAGVLRAAGYSDDDIRAMTERYDIEKAAPQFVDLPALAAYCGVLGDWRSRWARLLILLPQVELRRALKP